MPSAYDERKVKDAAAMREDIGGLMAELASKQQVWCCSRCHAIYRKEFPFCPADGAEVVAADTDPLIGEEMGLARADLDRLWASRPSKDATVAPASAAASRTQQSGIVSSVLASNCAKRTSSFGRLTLGHRRAAASRATARSR